MIRTCFFLAILTVFLASEALGESADWSKTQQKFKSAFKTIQVPPPAQIDKAVSPMLPEGIVIDSGPFDQIANKLLEPYLSVFSSRVEALKAVGQDASARAGGLVKDAFKTMAGENKDWAARVELVEKVYSSAYNKGYMESSEEDKRVRKIAAVLIPFYLGLVSQNEKAAGAAVEALALFKEGDGLKWLCGGALADSETGLRRAAVEALGAIGGDQALEGLKKALEKDKDAGVRASALGAMMSWKLSEARASVVAALSDQAWEVRALAVAICGRGRLVEAAPALIECLGREEGRLRQDIDDVLQSLLGMKFYGDAELWKKWLKDNQAVVDELAAKAASEGLLDKPLGKVSIIAPPEAGDKSGEEHKGATASFYGITTFSKKIIFVIDISKSMESEAGGAVPETTGQGAGQWTKPKDNTKIGIAKWQLHRAVHALPKDAVFNIIVYSESYKVWQEEMTQANPRNVALAHDFIESLLPNGTTNIYDSLSKAFEIAGAGPPGVVVTGKKKELAADTVFLLSDGVPNRGRITNPEAILADVTARNKAAGIVIHSVGIGEAAGSPFMKKLAEDNGGRYVEFK